MSLPLGCACDPVQCASNAVVPCICSCHSRALKLKPRAVRKRLEGDVVAEIRSAIGRLPWAVCWRNNVGQLKDERGIPVTYGLCEGSSDLVGIVKVVIAEHNMGVDETTGRWFSIEVKKPGNKVKPESEQARFLDVVRHYGGAATWVDNVEDAIAFLERVRAGIE